MVVCSDGAEYRARIQRKASPNLSPLVEFRATVNYLETHSESTSTARQLHDLLADGTEINIICHNNPDPDCLASALALGRISAAAGIDERHIFYSGSPNRGFSRVETARKGL